MITELDKLRRAKLYMEKLANGINPLDDSEIPEADVVNQVRLSRCFFYVADVLDGLIAGEEAESAIRVTRPRRTSFVLTDEERAQIPPADRTRSVSEIADTLNGVIDTDAVRRISAATVNDWLESLGLLERQIRADGKSMRVPTAEGLRMGISTEDREGSHGPYTVLRYSPAIQEFIYDNTEAIMASKKTGHGRKRDAQ